YNFVNCFAIHYCQHGTYRLLKQTQRKLSTNVLNLEEDQAMEQIRELALVNYELNQILSVPNMIFVWLNCCNTILAVCMTVMCQLNAALLCYCLLTCAYMCYLVWLNHRVIDTLKQIFTHLHKRYSTMNCHRERLFETIAHKEISANHLNNSNGLSILESDESRQMRFGEMEIYCDHFAIKIYHISNIDMQFLFQIGLFMINYIVFITQTN